MKTFKEIGEELNITTAGARHLYKQAIIKSERAMNADDEQDIRELFSDYEEDNDAVEEWIYESEFRELFGFWKDDVL